MLGVSGLLGSSGDGAAAASGAAEGGGGSREGGGGGGEIVAVGSSSAGFSEEERGRGGGGGGGGGEEGERSAAGNRWPREETLALLKIRSDMDVAFRDSSLKGPLWDEVSRKLGEMGYQRSSKKCKEKFENVYKYHKRTKEGRASKADGKTYRFFDQLEALDAHYASLQQLPPPPPQRPQPSPAPLAAAPQLLPLPPIVSQQITVPSAAANSNPTNAPPTMNPSIPLQQPAMNPPPPPLPPHHHHHPHHQAAHSARGSMPVNFTSSNSTSYSSSSPSSDETLEEGGGNGRRKRKRKWKEFFERIMRGVIEKQEELQRKFLEAIEKRERDRMVREEAWRMQEMARINREHEILVQERSIAAAKDAALISFLQKMSPSDQQNPVQVPSVSEINPLQVSLISQLQPLRQQQQHPQQQPPPQPAVAPQTAPAPIPAMSIPEGGNNNKLMVFDSGVGGSTPSTSSSRWPKAEVEALIKLRTELDVKYQESGPKGPLWEEISAGMRGMGYSRSSKRCKEKWENINKYFKKVKESNKKRPEDSKTCPYFHQLDALYREKNRAEGAALTAPSMATNLNPNYALPAPENAAVNNPMVPLMVRPEQQWPPVQIPQEARPQPLNSTVAEDTGSENIGQNLDQDDDDDDDGDEEEDEGSGYEIVTNKQGSSMATAGGE